MLGEHRVELAGVPEGELAQQGSHGGGGIHPVEEGFHATGADQVDIVDVVRAGAHPRDQGGQFRGRVGCPGLDPRRARCESCCPTTVSDRLCSARAITGTRPAHDTRLSSSNTAESAAERVGHLHWKCLS